MKLSLCITTFNRYELLKESYALVIDDPRISEIIIVDDCSTEPGIKEKVNSLAGGKVKVFHQAQNRGMSMNKRDAISYASNPWVIIFDSDNIIGKDYLDAFWKNRLQHEWAFDVDNSWPELHNETMHPPNIIYCPSWAKPEFDFRKYEMDQFRAKEAAKEIRSDSFNLMMNCCNCIINRDFYLKTYQYNEKHIASDTIWYAYNHLKAGGSFYIVPDMHYFHRVHKGSGFLQGVDHNMRMQNDVRKLIMALK
jgi:glycosyltransferase involved in cell wall biosynthesis